MTCREVAEFLADYLAGEVPQEVAAEFDRHMKLCPPCVIYLDSYRRVIEMGKSVWEEQPKPIPEELVKAILAARQQSQR